MSMFGGTTQKCKACEKTVYFVEQLTADGKVFHKTCFRCHHCKGTLKLSNYSSFEGVLYCKPHFDQLFKMTGSLDKSFEGAPRSTRVDRSAEQGQSNSRVLSFFAGTQEKCVACKKTVYPIEKVAVDGTSYHKVCFRCARGGCVISPSNFVAHEHRLYCKHHHNQLFREKGNFSQLDHHEGVKELADNAAPKVVIAANAAPQELANNAAPNVVVAANAAPQEVNIAAIPTPQEVNVAATPAPQEANVSGTPAPQEVSAATPAPQDVIAATPAPQDVIAAIPAPQDVIAATLINSSA